MCCYVRPTAATPPWHDAIHVCRSRQPTHPQVSDSPKWPYTTKSPVVPVSVAQFPGWQDASDGLTKSVLTGRTRNVWGALARALLIQLLPYAHDLASDFLPGHLPLYGAAGARSHTGSQTPKTNSTHRRQGFRTNMQTSGWPATSHTSK